MNLQWRRCRNRVARGFSPPSPTPPTVRVSQWAVHRGAHGWLRAGRWQRLTRSGSSTCQCLPGSSMWSRCRALGSFRVRHDPAVVHLHRHHRHPNRPPQVRTQCFRVQAPHLPYTPYRPASLSGASSPWGARPSMRFLFVTSLLCTPASSGPVLANAPLPSASGCLAHDESKSVLPQGTCTP